MNYELIVAKCERDVASSYQDPSQLSLPHTRGDPSSISPGNAGATLDNQEQVEQSTSDNDSGNLECVQNVGS